VGQSPTLDARRPPEAAHHEPLVPLHRRDRWHPPLGERTEAVATARESIELGRTAGCYYHEAQAHSLWPRPYW